MLVIDEGEFVFALLVYLEKFLGDLLKLLTQVKNEGVQFDVDEHSRVLVVKSDDNIRYYDLVL